MTLLRKLNIIGLNDYVVNCLILINQFVSFREIRKRFFSFLCICISKESVVCPLMFLNYVKDVSMAVKCNLFVYASKTCLTLQSRNVKGIEK